MTNAVSSTRKSGKNEREKKILLGLIDCYIKTSKPVGSNTLKEAGFEDLSSATIRNYFAHLEEEGYLTQQHSSGGRIPTAKAFRLYAYECIAQSAQKSPKEKVFDSLQKIETRAINTLLQQAAEQLALLTHTAVFLSAPRFDQDFIVSMKLVAIDVTRCLCVMMTDFGEIKTEILHVDNKLGTLSAKRIEAYFNWRLNGQQKPDNLSTEEEELAKKLYNELLVRYIVGYSQFNEEEIYRTGFSGLLNHPEFQDPTVLADSLALFENTHGIRLLLKECSKHNTLKLWIGDDLLTYASQPNPDCSIIAIPYHVNNQPVGAVGLLGPQRLPYRTLFALLQNFSQRISEAMTRNLYKFKITLKPPKEETIDLKKRPLIAETRRLLLEDRSNNSLLIKKQDSSKKTARRK